MLCRYCELWELKSGDAFCSFCGSLLERFTVSSSKSTLYYQEGEKTVITIENDGDSLQEISLIKPAIPWLYVDSEIVQPKSIKLKPAEKKQITLRLEKPPQLETLPPPFVLQFFPITNKRVKLELKFNFKSPSEIKTEGSFENISVSKDKKNEKFLMAVKNIGDDPIVVNSITWKYTDSKPEGITLSSSNVPHTITKMRPFGIKLELDYNKLRAKKISEHNNSLVLSFPDNEMLIPVSLNMKIPSIQLVAQKEGNKIDFIEVDAFQKKSVLKKLILKNTGNAEADVRFDFVQKVIPDNPGNSHRISWQSDDLAKKYVNFHSPVQRKLQLAAKSQLEFALIFDFKKFASELKDTDKEKSHYTTLQFVYDYSQESDSVEIPVHFTYIRPEDSFEYIGIDFGTTNSVVAIFENNGVQTVKEAESDNDLIPSVIYFETPEVFDIGTEAYQNAQRDYDNAAFSIKRILGNDYKRKIRGREMEPTDIAACIMKSLKEKSEEYLRNKNGKPQRIKSAIITVPANFYDAQIKAIMKAYEKAGFEIPGSDAHVTLDEPTAAGYYYIQKLSAKDEFKDLKTGSRKHFLIFDFGGGTLDITVAVLERDVDGNTFFKIKSNRGENSLGGENLDFVIFEYNIMDESLKNIKTASDIEKIKNLYVKEPYNKLRREFKKYFDRDIEFSSFRDTRFLLKEHAEKIKIDLSDKEEVKENFRDTILWDINEQGKLRQASTGKPIEISVSRKLYERYCGATKREIEKIIDKALKAAQVTADNIDYVIHTGRSSLNLWVQELLKKKFPPIKVKHILEREELKMCVAKGAAYWGRALGVVKGGTDEIKIGENGRRFPLPHSYGTEVIRFANFFYDEIIPAGTLFPMEKPALKVYDKKNLPEGGLLRLRFYQNEGTETRIDGNPEIRIVGRVDVKLEPTDVECRIEIMVDANRRLKIKANGKEANIIPEQLETVQEWW